MPYPLRTRLRANGAVWQCVRADLRSRRVAAGSVVLVIVLATWLISLGWTALGSMATPFDRLFDELHGAHVWLFLPADPPPSELSIITGSPNVVAATAPEQVAYTSVIVAAGKLPADLQSFPVGQPAMGQLQITAGAALAADDPNGVILDQPFAESHGLHVGDPVSIVTPRGRVALRVRGLCLDVNHNVVHDGRLARVFLLRSTLQGLFAGPAAASHLEGIIGLRLTNPNAVSATVATITQQVKAQGGTVSFRADDWLDYRNGFTSTVRLAATLLLAFGIAGVLGAGIIVANLIAGQVLAHRRELGILKAVGFTRFQLVFQLVVVYLLLGLVGGLVGLGLAAVSAPLLMAHVGLALGVAAAPRVDALGDALVLAAVLGVVALFAVLPAWRAASLRTESALRPASAPRNSRLLTLGRLGAPRMLLLGLLGLRGVTGRPGRAAFLVLILLIAVVMSVFSTGLIATIQQYASDPAVQGYYSDVHVSPDFYDPAATQQLVATRPEIASYYSDLGGAASLASGGTTKINLNATAGDTHVIAQSVADGRWYRDGADELVVNSFAQQKYELRVGQQVTLLLASGAATSVPVAFTVVGVLPSLAGVAVAYMPMSSFTRHIALTPAAQLAATAYEVTLRSGTRPQDFVGSLLSATDDRIGAQVNGKTLPAAVRELPLLVAALAAVLMLIAAVNVFTAMTLTTRERYRELGTLKAVGLTPRQVLALVTLGAVTLAVLALAAGIPLGLWLTALGLSAAGRAEGFAGVHIAISWSSVAIIVPATLVVAAVGAYLPARWAVRIKPSDALRYE